MSVINEKKFSKLQYSTFKNVLSLQNDALLIYKAKSFGTALFMSVIAQEELGKVFIIDDLIYHNRYGEVSVDDVNKYYFGEKAFFNHKIKQIESYSMKSPFGTKKEQKFIEYVISGKLEKLKQESLYVGLINKSYKGRILTPKNVTKLKAKDHLNFVNNLLIEIAEWKINQSGLFDGLFIDNLINRKLLKKLIIYKNALNS
jgi:AbiV family abortive infection protein